MNPAIANKLHHPGLEDKTIAILAYILEQDWPTAHPRILEIRIINDGQVWAKQVENQQTRYSNLATADGLFAWWTASLDYAAQHNGLTPQEREEATAAYRSRITVVPQKEAKVPCPQCGSTHYEARVDNDIDTYNASVLGMAGLSFFGPTAGVVGALIGGTPSGKTYFFCLDCGCKFVKKRK